MSNSQGASLGNSRALGIGGSDDDTERGGLGLAAFGLLRVSPLSPRVEQEG